MITEIRTQLKGVSRFSGKLTQTNNSCLPIDFLIHTLDSDDFVRVYPESTLVVGKYRKRYNDGKKTMLDNMLSYLDQDFLKKDPLAYVKVTSRDKSTEAIFHFVPYLSQRFREQGKREEILKAIFEKIDRGYKMGARIFGLGAFNSIITCGGKYILDHHSLAKEGKIAVTSGNALTAGAAYQAVLNACQFMEIIPHKSVLTVVGATGSIGQVISRMLAGSFSKINILARNQQEINKLQRSLVRNGNNCPIQPVTDKNLAIKESDCIIFVTSVVGGLDELEMDIKSFKSGSVIIDVGRPKTISSNFYDLRQDILAIEGGIFNFPNTPFILGMGEETIFACALETILLGLEGELRNSGIGAIRPNEVEYSLSLARKYGFSVSGFRMFDKPLSTEFVNQIKNNAGR